MVVGQFSKPSRHTLKINLGGGQESGWDVEEGMKMGGGPRYGPCRERAVLLLSSPPFLCFLPPEPRGGQVSAHLLFCSAKPSTPA